MHTSLLLLALTGPGAAPHIAAPDTPRWQDSYSSARKVGREQGKPLAVFIASGSAGWENVTDDGKPSRRSRQLLAEHFVCLHVNSATPEGQRLAEAFNIPSGPGLVVSTRSGDGQAFRHQGTLSRGEL